MVQHTPMPLFGRLALRHPRSSHSLARNLGPKPTVLTIKAEHPTRIWERRTPLVPDDVARLVTSLGPGALAVRVESSAKRIYPDEAYRAVSP